MTEDLDALISAVVDAALAEQADRLEVEAQARILAALEQQAANNEAAATAALIDASLARLPIAIGAALRIEDEKQERISAMLEGLAAALDAAIAIEVEAYAKRPVKVAIFDEVGQFIGTMESRADLLDLHIEDPFTRVVWREAWDALRPTPVEGSRPVRWVLPVPALHEILDLTPEEISRPFAEYPVPRLG